MARNYICHELQSKGYSIKSEKSRPYADIVATKDGTQVEYYEIKATTIAKQDYETGDREKIKYFGAATLTEVNLAVKIPDRYKFVIVYLNKDNPSDVLDYFVCSFSEILKIMTIPPFKFNFNISLKNGKIFEQKHRNETVCAIGTQKEPYVKVKQLADYYQNTLKGKIVCPDTP